MFGSFVARKLLETASSAILARMDPTRFLILQEYQMRAGGNYRAHERHAAAIAWTGDIIPDKPSSSLWSTETSPDKFVRSLFGGHLAEIAWPQAIEKFIAEDADRPASEWLEEISRLYEEKHRRTEVPPAQPTRIGQPPTTCIEVLGVFRSKAQDMYSSLSKGVHLEFVVDETVILDSDTIIQNIRTVVKFITQMAYLSNQMDCIFTKVGREQANQLLVDIENRFEAAA